MTNSFTALHISAQNGHLAVTVDLVKAGADLEVRVSDGTTPLGVAAQHGHSAVVEALVKAGADVDSSSWDGATPLLFFAAGQGYLNAVKTLPRAKANPLLAVTSASSGKKNCRWIRRRKTGTRAWCVS